MSASPAPERWLVVEVPRPNEPLATEILIEELRTLSGRGVEERPDRLIAYLVVEEGRAGPTLDQIETRLAEILPHASTSLTHRWQDHEDWAELWRRGVEPKRITSRLVVSPTWEEPELRAGDLLVSIDPGLAFGTAEHPTTRGCLRLLDRIPMQGRRVADIGTGSGILAIAAILLGADQVMAVDEDPWACATARDNVRTNEVGERIEVIESRVEPDFLAAHGPFGGIVSNLETHTLIPLFPGFRRGLDAGGWLIVSGVLAEETSSVCAAAESAGFELSHEDLEAGWWTGGFMC